MIRKIQGGAHRLLAKSDFATSLAVKFRNQANFIIGYHLGETTDSFLNGEFSLIRLLAPHIRTFIDVGANVGSWSEFVLAETRGKGYLFEPSNQCFKVLKEKFPGDNVILRNAAVSETPGVAEFAEEQNFGELSSLVDNRAIPQGATVRQVPVITLTQEFSTVPGAIDFLKIDTEGYDLRVLKGAAEGLLPRTRFIQFEYNTFWLFTGATLAQAMGLLKEQGFSLFLIRSTGLHPFRYEVWSDFFRYSNFFACRQEDFEAIRPLLREPI